MRGGNGEHDWGFLGSGGLALLGAGEMLMPGEDEASADPECAMPKTSSVLTRWGSESVGPPVKDASLVVQCTTIGSGGGGARDEDGHDLAQSENEGKIGGPMF